jgi:hypothetical protein
MMLDWDYHPILGQQWQIQVQAARLRFFLKKPTDFHYWYYNWQKAAQVRHLRPASNHFEALIYHGKH